MSKIQSPIIGHASQQAGGMVFYKLDKSKIMRSKPLKVNDAKSDAQIVQREAFATRSISINRNNLVSEIPNYLDVIIPGKKIVKFKAGSDLATKTKDIYKPVAGVNTLLPQNMTIGGSPIVSYRPLTLSISGGDATFTWDKTQAVAAITNTAKIAAFLFVPQDRCFVRLGGALTIADETATLPIPGYLTEGAEATVFLCTYESDTTKTKSKGYFEGWGATPDMVGTEDLTDTISFV